MRRWLCRIGIHQLDPAFREPTLGAWPWPHQYRCLRCSAWIVDHGPAVGP